MNMIHKKRALLSVIYSAAFSVSLLIGLHLHIDNIYSGTQADNFFIPLGISDVLIVSVSFLLCSLWSYYFLDRHLFCTDWNKRIPSRYLICTAIVLFLCYLPWLLAYFPGFIFGDSLSSISQSMGKTPYSNHHPLFYTLFIKLCMKSGIVLFSSRTIGLGIYSLLQMIFLSAGYSYIINWCIARFKLPFWTLALGVLFYGISPYMASYSIAIWKDPAFSVSIAVLTCLLMDVIKKKQATRKEALIIIVLCLIIIFSRNNGIYIMIGAFIIALAYYLKQKKLYFKKGLCAIMILILGSFLITHPLFNYYGLNIDGREETYGVLINQMARVAAYEQDLDNEEIEYLDKLLPFDRYAETYRPCCVDLLKWDSEFNKSVLKEDFFKKWVSIGIKNPGDYIKSWILTTGGFWLPYTKASLQCQWNITGGVPRNLYPDRLTEIKNSYGIYPENLFGSDLVYKVLKVENRCVPIGIIAWILLYLCIVLAYRKEYELLFAGTGLTVCLLLTLALASPIFYWPRYGLSVQILLPVYCLLILAVGKDEPSRLK